MEMASSFQFQTLPHDLALKVTKLVAKNGVRDVVSLAVCCKEIYRIAFSQPVLRQLSLHEFIAEPALVNEGTHVRRFFLRCVRAGNHTACYLEGLRLLGQRSFTRGALRVLNSAAEQSEYLLFAKGVVLIFSRDYHGAVEMFRELKDLLPILEDRVSIGWELVHHLRAIGTVPLHRLARTWMFRDVPTCLNNPCTLDSPCEDCYIFWSSVHFMDLA